MNYQPRHALRESIQYEIDRKASLVENTVRGYRGKRRAVPDREM